MHSKQFVQLSPLSGKTFAFSFDFSFFGGRRTGVPKVLFFWGHPLYYIFERGAIFALLLTFFCRFRVSVQCFIRHSVFCCQLFLVSVSLVLCPLCVCGCILLYPFNRLLKAAQIVSSSSALAIILVIIFIHQIEADSFGFFPPIFLFFLYLLFWWVSPCLKVFNKLTTHYKWKLTERMWRMDKF